MKKNGKDNFNNESANPYLGVYPQRQTGLYMQRIKIFGGRIGWQQWRRIAELAGRYSNKSPIHITTRQDIELHNIRGCDIASVHKGLAEVLLSTSGTGGNSIRNITQCSGCDLMGEGFDLMPIASLVNCELSVLPEIYNLPRKFKISFSGCPKACAKPWLSDLGFIAGSAGLFRLIGAGSFGPRPALGIELYQNLKTSEILSLCIASLKLFEQFGDRQNRRRARFRHIREKFGDERFKDELDYRFKMIKQSQMWPDITIVKRKNKVRYFYRLQLACGNINTQQAIELAEIAEPRGAVLRINLEHGLEIYSDKKIELPLSLSEYLNKPIIIACPGGRSCPNGLTDTNATSEAIRRELKNTKILSQRICISGCPNGCAHSYTADIGLLGQKSKQNGRTIQCYRLYCGGGNGENGRFARERELVLAQDAPKLVKELITRTDE